MIAVMNDMLAEYFYSDLNVKIANTETTSKYIMAMPEPNRQEIKVRIRDNGSRTRCFHCGN